MAWKTFLTTFLLANNILQISAVPNVTVIPMKVGYAAFLNKDPQTDITVPFVLQATSTENTTIEG